ncbi:two-component regulator propeller domain-containing protein [Paucibacter soli]|uniref:two-component regulator propeller domain-containing protein n=1 Tax=Paucibacter soli TaxID=3133433 RepID=UPI0030B157E9
MTQPHHPPPRALKGHGLLPWVLGLLLALLPCLAAPAAAAPARWSALAQTGFQHLRQEQGLPNEIATSVAQDDDGFLWVGTLSGLARWDGYRFRVYKADAKQATALPDNFIQTLHADAAGRLWIGTSGAGLVRYERASNSFTTLPVGQAGLSHVSVNSIIDDGNGGLWVGTNGGLDHVDAASSAIQRQSGEAAGLSGLQVLSLLRSRDGSLWVGTDAGLFRREVRAPRFAAVPLPTGARQPRTLSLYEDSLGQVWVGTAQHGAFTLAREQVRAVALGREPVVGIIEARPGEIWLGTLTQGIQALELATGQTRAIRHLPSLPASLADNAVRGFLRDRSGLVWVASNRGLSRHDPGQAAVLTMYGAPPCARRCDVGEQATSNEVSWILPVGPDRFWLGTHKRGVEIIDSSGALVAALRPDARRPEAALPADIVLALERGGDGQIYIATKRGLYRAAADGSRVSRVQWPGRDPAASTWALLAEGDNKLWIGGQSDGLWSLDLRSGQARLELRGRGQRLSDERIVVLARAAAGGIWVGTRNGLNHLEPATGAVRPVPLDLGNTGARPSAGFITTLYTDRQQRLWVGSYGGGIKLLAPDGQQRRIGLAEGLPDETVNALLEDGQGHLWVSTDNGLARIHPSSLEVRALRRAEGVAFQTYWTGSAARSSEGELLFGGAGGMTIVRPAHVQPWSYRPPLVISELHVGGQQLMAGSLEIQPDANSFAVEYAALDYSAPDRNRYAHRLLGFERDWIASDATRRLASYTNLPPGQYQLQLRGSNRDGVWSEAVLSLPIRVLPAWHQTLWFKLLLLMLLLLALVAVVQLRTRWLRRRQRELELKVGERTAALEQVSRALEEKSRVLELASISDPLTGLHNRRFLAEHIEAEIAASQRRAREAGLSAVPPPVDTDSLFFLIDIDHFKQVNDRYGHAAGDAVLVQFGRRLRTVLRESDHLVRWGGEEFLAVARDTDRLRVQELAERLRSVVVESPFVLDGGRMLAITSSIGFACLPFVDAEPRALGWQDVVRLADLALLTAKRCGRNAWVGLAAGPGLRERGGADALMLRAHSDLQACVHQGELQVYSSRDEALVLAALRRPPAQWREAAQPA